ncbi:Hypothetical protein ORPV_285 [Orpheovirus IHUMI-LCC2]|uniref:Uncharacterized protein n=1 Tax=Orpheovirus IHUMI-LCC2 TaxID=2023057 RepID=A0A2I2L3Z8_9VIRU|nr:Hypothetical protein ORPV_285 [Orpheovirus IHUMI-LCC2]SNW62189.1 Hypothetical protein ORPV_285 [Orpheovirus IHUMI-LCC2]
MRDFEGFRGFLIMATDKKMGNFKYYNCDQYHEEMVSHMWNNGKKGEGNFDLLLPKWTEDYELVGCKFLIEYLYNINFTAKYTKLPREKITKYNGYEFKKTWKEVRVEYKFNSS